MNDEKAKEILDRIVGQLFGYQNPLSLDAAMQKFAFDVRLPQEVYEVETGKQTWAASMNQNNFLTSELVQAKLAREGELQPYRKLESIEDVLSAWQKVDYSTAERQIASKNVSKSDGVYHSENVYRSIDIRKSKNILFSDGMDSSEYIVAGQTSKSSEYAIRVEDSKNISNSFNVVWSNKITRGFFIQDCFDLYECMFCTHLAGKKFCIANIQFEEAEYREIQKKVIIWILSS